jgi:hypothetical protein
MCTTPYFQRNSGLTAYNHKEADEEKGANRQAKDLNDNCVFREIGKDGDEGPFGPSMAIMTVAVDMNSILRMVAKVRQRSRSVIDAHIGRPCCLLLIDAGMWV